MTPRSWTIRARLTAWYLAVLVPATIALAWGSWWATRDSLLDAADRHLRARIESAERLLRGMEHELNFDEIRDELHEYAELTLGDGLIEVTDATGLVLCRPPMAGWMGVRSSLAVPPPGAPQALGNAELDGRPVRVTAASAAIGARTYTIVAALPMGPAADALRRVAWLLGAAVPALLVVAGLGGYWISRRALAPVDAMTSAVRTLTVRSLDHRLDVPAPDDELRRLATTFNDMLARIEVGVAEMARFTADAAHELRTPVALVRTTADVALSREREGSELRQALADVLTHTEQMTTLVSGLLALARADAGVEEHEHTRVDLAEIARTAAASVAPSSERRGLRVVVEAPGPAAVEGDGESLRRLVLILLDNALNYTPSGGSVTVRVTPDAAGSTARLEVEDTGPGIEAADRPRVFDRFYRGAAARQAAAGGTGLGLSIARSIVERHGGRIEVADRPSGMGCCLSVTLALDSRWASAASC